MTSETGTSRTADDIRDYLLRQLNSALRRPEMFGAETALRLYFDALAFTDRGEQAWAEDLSALRSREAFTPAGVTGAVERVLGHRAADVMASVYAEIARQRAWLTLDNGLPEADHRPHPEPAARLVRAGPEPQRGHRRVRRTVDAHRRIQPALPENARIRHRPYRQPAHLLPPLERKAAGSGH